MLRLEDFMEIRKLHHDGWSVTEIARHLDIDRKTVRKYLKQAPREYERQPKSWKADPWRPYLRERWEKGVHNASRLFLEIRKRGYLEQRWRQGCHNAAQLWRELQAQGFAGRPHTLRDWLQKQYGRRRERQKQQAPKPSQVRTSPRKATWQILKQPQEAQPFLEEIYRRSPEIAALAATAREFFRIIRERDAAAWPEWQRTASTNSLSGFAKHLCRDEATFLAALEHPWSNGPVEGQVHRLKLIKRSMYGRAGFELLRLRVLSAA